LFAAAASAAGNAYRLINLLLEPTVAGGPAAAL